MARKRTEPQSRRAKSDVAGLVPGRAPAPDEIKLNAISAERLASLAGLETNEVQGQTIAAISEQLKWAIDPEWLFFRRVCGRVVKTDPDSGISYPVPYATVHVLDTDCDFWGYFPEGWLYAWLFPLRCHTEELTKVVTDECGNFCVWIPRFEIEWICAGAASGSVTRSSSSSRRSPTCSRGSRRRPRSSRNSRRRTRATRWSSRPPSPSGAT